MTRFKLLCLVLLLSFECSLVHDKSPSYDLKVYSNGYRGRMAISELKNFFFIHDEVTNLTIKPDTTGKAYFLNTGASVGGCGYSETSYIYLFFKNGLLDSICPKESATIGDDGKSLALKTTSITIDPGAFKKAWTPSFGVENSGHYYVKQTLPLINGQTYVIADSDANLAQTCTCNLKKDSCEVVKINQQYSAFKFTVDALGEVKLFDRNKASATVSKDTLKFQTVSVDIDPLEISEGKTLYMRTPNPQQPIEITKRTQFHCIRAIVNYVYSINADSSENIFYFMPM